MKKNGLILALMLVALLTLTACAQTIEEDRMPSSTMESDMTKDDDMGTEETDMTKDDDMGTEETDMSKDDDMGTEETDMSKDDDMGTEQTDMSKDDDMGTEETDMSKDDDMTGEHMTNEGDPSPEFMFKTLADETVSLADFEGEKVYVKFWASWCSICLGGLEDIDLLSAQAEGYKIITVVTPNFRGEQSTQDFKAWYDGRMMENMTVLIDEDGQYAKEFGVRAYPTSAFIGSDGVLVAVHPGHLSNAQIEEAMTLIY